jgi:hypothetical protein
MASEQLIVLPIQAVYPGRAREASVYVEALNDSSTPGCLVHANLFAHEDGTGTVGVLLPDLFAEHRVKGGALSVKVCVPEDHKQDSSDDLWRLVEGASTTPVKGMDGVLNSVVLPGSFTPVVQPVIVACAEPVAEPVAEPAAEPAAEPVAEPVAVAKKARRGRTTNVAPDLTLAPPPRGGWADAFGFTG